MTQENWSGRRESNPHYQLGNFIFCLSIFNTYKITQQKCPCMRCISCMPCPIRVSMRDVLRDGGYDARRLRGRVLLVPTLLLGSTLLYRSFPEYDRLKDLLQRGKSGTMFFSRANESGGQLTNDGSLIFTR